MNNPCTAGCGRPAMTGSNLCFTHQSNPEQEYRRICAYIARNKSIKDLNVSGMRFENNDFSGKHFYGCNFKETFFINCKLTGIKTRMSFFDFSVFTNCDFKRSDLQFISFAGSKIKKCDFEGSEIIHVNFEGAEISNTSFNNLSLNNSRFIASDLGTAMFFNCNLKHVNFLKAKLKGVVFKSSNSAESIREESES
jgi:uncharacterized protein YjbI with pentapeptide repeats